MKILFLLALISAPSFAAPYDWVPIKDSRFDFYQCGANGLVSLNKPDELQGCLGFVTGTKINVLVIRPANSEALETYQVLSQQQVRAVGDEDGAFGLQVWSLEIKKYDLGTKTVSGRATELTLTHSWEYSQGVLLLEGKTPAGYKLSITLEQTDDKDPWNH